MPAISPLPPVPVQFPSVARFISIEGRDCCGWLAAFMADMAAIVGRKEANNAMPPSPAIVG